MSEFMRRVFDVYDAEPEGFLPGGTSLPNCMLPHGPDAEAHVPINATDDHGFTPLMYAATIDFGDDDVLKALLKAGADKSIRNYEGRTPLAQAKHYRYSRLEQSLR